MTPGLLNSIEKVERSIQRLKNCGIASGGFQSGNTCARGGGGGAGSVKTNSAGEEFHSASRGEDKIWRTADGKAVPEHIQKLGIPPAWKDVHVNLNAKANTLATGVDAKGRTQTKYSANHTMKAAANKFGRVSELRKMRKQIFTEVKQDMKTGDKRTKEDAAATMLIMKTGMRPGSESDTGADYKSYGATTLEGRHIVQKSDGSVVAKFVPGKKKGQEIEMPITDKGLAKELLKRAKKAGPNGRVFNTTAGRVRNYSKTKDGGGFKTKDHRTALGTETAIAAMKSLPMPKTKKEYKASVKAVSTAVSDVLGNTPSIAFKSYIDPVVFSKWNKVMK